MSGRRILLVEDEPMVRSLLAKYLRKSGAEVTEAATKAVALETYQVQSDPFDVVVTDVHLPDGSGLDLALDIRHLRETQPIVFVTGDVSESVARAAKEYEGAGYLLKPFDFKDLDASINQALGNVTRVVPAAAAAPAGRLADRDHAWLMRQRELLESAARQPVELRMSEPPPSRIDFIWLGRAVLTVLLLLLLALAIGYITGPDAPPAITPREEAPAVPAAPRPPPPTESR